jgi:RecA/RadA recombinase
MAKASTNALLDRLKKNSTLENTSVLTESRIFDVKEYCPTDIPVLDIACSGTLDGGLTPGMLQIAGPSKHFKTSFLLVMVRAFQRKYPEGIVLFYDSEFGSPPAYFEAFGLDLNRILHIPITNIEEFKHDITKQLDGITLGEKVMIAVDSIGNLASKKELDDALEGKSVADMTRAKQLKSISRIITPHLNLKAIPMVIVNHVYEEMGLFPKTIVGGGQGLYLSSDNIWIVGRQQVKEGKDVIGYDFMVRIEKSRFVKEKSVFPITVTHDGGIARHSGLLDIALLSGHVIKPNQGWYQKVNSETGELAPNKYREADTHTDEFWNDILKDENFRQFVKSTYQVAYGNTLTSYEETVDVGA